MAVRLACRRGVATCGEKGLKKEKQVFYGFYRAGLVPVPGDVSRCLNLNAAARSGDQEVKGDAGSGSNLAERPPGCSTGCYQSTSITIYRGENTPNIAHFLYFSSDKAVQCPSVCCFVFLFPCSEADIKTMFVVDYAVE